MKMTFKEILGKYVKINSNIDNRNNGNRKTETIEELFSKTKEPNSKNYFKNNGIFGNKNYKSLYEIIDDSPRWNDEDEGELKNYNYESVIIIPKNGGNPKEFLSGNLIFCPKKNINGCCDFDDLFVGIIYPQIISLDPKKPLKKLTSNHSDVIINAKEFPKDEYICFFGEKANQAYKDIKSYFSDQTLNQKINK